MPPEADLVAGRRTLRSVARLDHRGVMLLLYVLSFWPLLVNNGVFWDDWVFYGQKPQTLQRLFAELGTSPVGRYLGRALVAVPPVAGRWFVFTVYLVAMLVTYRILVKTKLFGRNAALLLTLLASLIPYNFARVTMACAGYAVYYLLFLLAFLALVEYVERKWRVLRLASLLLFFLSFGMGSLLIYYLIPMMYVAYRERPSPMSLKGAGKEIASYLDFIVIPVVFYLLKSAFFVAHGIYGSYQTVSANNFIQSPYEFVLSVWSSFAGVIGRSLAVASGSLLLLVVLTVAVYWLLGKRTPDGGGRADARATAARRFLLGVLAFYLGVLPYLAIGRDGATFGLEWESRDQLLLGMGAALMLFYGLTYLFAVARVGIKLQTLVLAVLVASFVLANVTAYLEFQRDWYKQVAFMEIAKDLPSIRGNTTFTVEDNAVGLNAMNRRMQFYEYTGALKRTFGTTTRLAVPASDMAKFGNPDFVAKLASRPQYNFGDWVRDGPTRTIVVDPGEHGFGLAKVGRLLAEELLDPAAFRVDVKQALVIHVEPAE